MTSLTMINLSIILFTTCLGISNIEVWAAENTRVIEEHKVIDIINQTEAYIQQYGKAKAIEKFKMKSSMIFAIDFNGNVLASPLHPETVNTNQINFKDSTGLLAVKEEINEARAGGGWLKGRYRKNHITDQYECRRLYIRPMKGHYFIGSWYHYTPNKDDNCLI